MKAFAAVPGDLNFHQPVNRWVLERAQVAGWEKPRGGAR